MHYFVLNNNRLIAPGKIAKSREKKQDCTVFLLNRLILKGVQLFLNLRKDRLLPNST